MANEARLIDANALPVRKEYCVDEAGFGATFYVVHKNDIDNAPTVDAVKVTRCKDCQEFAPGFIRPYLGWCGVWDTTVRETGFCHHGKPRSEEKPKPVWPPQEEMEEPCED